MMRYRDLIAKSETILDDPHLGRLFLLEILRERGEDLFLLLDDEADKEVEEIFMKGLKKLQTGQPLAYVQGYQWFYGYQILVNEQTLIPRPETEELVAHVLGYLDRYFENPQVIDVATGSGAIAIALSKELSLPVIASDISLEALRLAKQSSLKNEADVTFLQGDMLEPFIEAGIQDVDVLLCNPPYIKEVEDVDPMVLNHEPHLALFGGEDGLYFYRKVFEKAENVLAERYLMAFEIGYDIGDDLRLLAQKYFPKAQLKVEKDINGLDRFLFISENLKE